MTTILVIGGTGNISRWFVKTLAQTASVTVFNRGQRTEHQTDGVTTVIGDRTHHAAFEAQMRALPHFDCVIDMVGYEPDDAHSAVRAFRGRTGQYIFCSTVDVYPKRPPSYPVSEQHPLGASPTFPYAFKKMEMEQIFTRAQEAGDFPLTIIRPAATYSEGWSPLVTCFGGQSYHLDRLRRGLPVVLHGDGSSIWVASHAHDVGRAFANAAGNANAIGKTYNVTGDELMTWRTMHEIVADVLGAPAPDFVYIPTDALSRMAPHEAEWCVENFQFNNIYDNTAAKTDLGYAYTIPYRLGVQRCIDHLLAHDGIESADNHPFYDAVVARWRKSTPY